METLFDDQLSMLAQPHVNILYWAAIAEDRDAPYNITNAFDDLKHLKLTRTKQTVYAFIEALRVCCFLDIKEQGNKKNLFITRYGAKALELLMHRGYEPSASHHLGG